MCNVATLVLAGGRLQAPDGTSCLAANLPIGKDQRTMEDIVCSAVVGSGFVDQLMIARDGVSDASYGYIPVPVGSNPIEHLANALRVGGNQYRHILICPVDQPFIGSRDVGRFLARALRHDVDFVYSHSHVSECVAAYPGMKRSGFFGLTGGNLMLFRTAKLSQILDSALQVYRVRKHPPEAVGRALMAIIRHRLSFRSVLCPPAVASDIDTWQHYLGACRTLGCEPLTTLSGIG